MNMKSKSNSNKPMKDNSSRSYNPDEMDSRSLGEKVKDLIDRAELEKYWEGGRN